MADVTGSIVGSDGTKDIQLNNAATEATLKLLLQSNLSANKQSLENIKALAQKSGLDPASIAAANANIQKVGQSGSKLGAGFEALGFAAGYASHAFTEAAELTKKIASGSAEASDVFGSLSKIGGVTGAVFSGMQKLASMQEAYLKTYQDLSSSGVNFGGSLTQMRMAASSTYMTLDGFAKLMKNNSESFAKMGGTANEGAQAFTKVAADMQKSQIGDQLRGLGYTSDQANQGLANYIAMTGGRNKEEMKNTKGLAAAAGEYMGQLDALAQITGKSREEQERQLKEASANAAYEAYLLTLDEEGKKKAQASMQNALATGGKAGADLLKSQLLGLPPMTDAAKKLEALGPNVANGIKQMGIAVNDSSKSMKDVEKGRAAAQAGATKDVERLGKGTLNALSMMSGPDAQAAMALQASANANTRNGIKTAEDAEKQMASITANQKERVTSEAAAAAEAKKNINELGQQIINRLMPIFSTLITYVNKATILFADFAKYLADSPKLLGALGLAVAALTAVYVASKVKSAAQGVMGLFGGGGGGNEPRGNGKNGGSGGFGKGVSSGMKGMASGLRAFANPQVMLGAIGFGVAIAAVGAGIAGAAWLTGKALPTLAEGLMKFTELDGGKLGATALGTGKLGLAVLTFAPFAVFGLPAGIAMNLLADGIVKLNSVDPAKLEKVAIAMQKVREATPTLGESLRSGVAGLVSKVVGTAEPAAAAAPTTATGPEANPANNLSTEIKTLNKTMTDLLKYMKETADNTRRNYDATRALDGNLFARP